MLADAATWPVTTIGSVVDPARVRRSRVVVAVVLWVLYSRTRFGFEAQVIGDSPRAARYAGMRTRRKIVAVMALSGAIAGIGGASQIGDFRHTLDAARPPAVELRLHGHRRRGARALQPVRGRARRVPARRARERRLHAAGRRLPVRARRRDAGADPVRDARRRAARPVPDHVRRARRATRRPPRGRRREQQHRRRRARVRRRLRHAAALRRARRAARRALGRAQPRRRGDDARRRRDGVPRRAARRRPGRASCFPSRRRRRARGRRRRR